MPYTTTETKLSVRAGDTTHVGTLDVGLGIMRPYGGKEEPPYDYGADAEAVIQFLARFLPRETWSAVQHRIRCEGT